MASRIYLSDMFGTQKKATTFEYDYSVHQRYTERAIIAKGNIIEGIEAKE